MQPLRAEVCVWFSLGSGGSHAHLSRSLSLQNIIAAALENAHPDMAPCMELQTGSPDLQKGQVFTISSLRELGYLNASARTIGR